MKIAVLCHLDYPISSPFSGGLEAHTWHLCRALIARGHQVTTFASGDSDPGLNVHSLTNSALQLDSTLTYSEREKIKQDAYQRALQYIRQHSFDVVHNNSLNTLPLVNAYKLSQPMVSVLHTPPFEKLAKAAAAADTVRFVAVSNVISQRWQPYVASQLIYNGIDVKSWPFSPTAQSRSAVWFGRFVPEKSPHRAIMAARMAGFTIKLAGPISDRGYFRQYVAPLLDGRDVKYLGHLSHTQLKTVIGQSAVFVKTPMWEEPYGLVYAESLACGTPVATFDSGAGKEILTSSCGRIAKSESLASLAKAILQAARLSRWACRQRAVEFCQLEDMVAAYERLYMQPTRIFPTMANPVAA